MKFTSKFLNAKTLALAKGAALQLSSDYPVSEWEHHTTIYSKALNAFFTSDFCYNADHMWLTVI